MEASGGYGENFWAGDVAQLVVFAWHSGSPRFKP